MENISQEEKINYIYDTLKKQEKRYYRWLYFKWAFRILIILYIYYFIAVLLPWIISNFKDIISPQLPSNINIESVEGIYKQELLNKFKTLYNK